MEVGEALRKVIKFIEGSYVVVYYAKEIETLNQLLEKYAIPAIDAGKVFRLDRVANVRLDEFYIICIDTES